VRRVAAPQCVQQGLRDLFYFPLLFLGQLVDRQEVVLNRGLDHERQVVELEHANDAGVHLLGEMSERGLNTEYVGALLGMCGSVVKQGALLAYSNIAGIVANCVKPDTGVVFGHQK
jgi:hypothetical protein